MSDKLFEYDNRFTFKTKKLPIGDLLQIAELSLISGGTMQEHIQPCDEITYVISGKATMYSNDTSAEISGGQIHFIRKGVKHRIVVGSQSFRYICIGLSLNENYDFVGKFIKNVPENGWFITNDDGNIRIFSEMLINEVYIPDEKSDYMVNLYISQIFVTLLRMLEGAKAKEKIFNQNIITTNFTIYHALRYIDREFMNIRSVKDVSKKLSYSEYYLSHLFKEKVGVSIKKYILKKKTDEAINLLKTSNMTVSEISEYVGFSTEHTFCQAFRRQTSMSPSEYKKSIERRHH